MQCNGHQDEWSSSLTKYHDVIDATYIYIYIKNSLKDAAEYQ